MGLAKFSEYTVDVKFLRIRRIWCRKVVQRWCIHGEVNTKEGTKFMIVR